MSNSAWKEASRLWPARSSNVGPLDSQGVGHACSVASSWGWRRFCRDCFEDRNISAVYSWSRPRRLPRLLSKSGSAGQNVLATRGERSFPSTLRIPSRFCSRSSHLLKKCSHEPDHPSLPAIIEPPQVSTCCSLAKHSVRRHFKLVLRHRVNDRDWVICSMDCQERYPDLE